MSQSIAEPVASRNTCSAASPRQQGRGGNLPAPESSERLLVRLHPSAVGMFRFLLEAHDHLAGFTVLDRRVALLKVFFSPHQARAAREALVRINELVPLSLEEWPKTSAVSHQP